MSVTRCGLCLVTVIVSYFGLVRNVELDTKIVGGTQVDIRNRPFQVSIQRRDQHFCGGALITRDTVLSAAHCFGISFPEISTAYDIKVGSNTTTGTSVKIKSVLVHPAYNETTINNDISLIKLATNVNISDKVALVRLSENGKYSTGSYASVSGWGYEEEKGTVSPLLRKVDVPLVPQRKCELAYAQLINITGYMICAGYPEGGKDACQGDSGGPLVQNNRLIGVVSFGMGCARKSYPGVYTNVANLLDWVLDNSNYSRNNTGNPDYFSGSCKTYANSLITILPLILLIKVLN